MYGYQCSKCSAYLDPGERCNCEEEMQRREEGRKRMQAALMKMFKQERNGQYRMVIEGRIRKREERV